MTDETTTTTAEPTPTAGAEAPTPGTAPQGPPPDRFAEAAEKARAMVAGRKDESAGARETEPQAAPRYADGAEEKPAGDGPATADSSDPAPAKVTVLKDPKTGKFVSKAKAEPEPVAEGGEAPDPALAPAEPEAAESRPGASTIRLVNRSGTEVEVALPADMEPEHVEALQIAAKSGMRRVEYKRASEAVERERDKLARFTGLLENQPESVLGSYLPAEKRVPVILSLLQDPDVFAQVTGTIYEWEQDPSKRSEARAESLRQELARRDDAEHSASLQRHFTTLQNAVLDMIPETMEDADADDFFRDAMTDIHRTMKDRNRVIGVGEVPDVIARRLQRYGLDAAPGPGKNGTTPASAPASPRPADTGGRPEVPPTTGSPETPPDRRLLATTPQGSGARAGRGLGVPKDISFSSTRDFLAKRLGIARQVNP